MFLKLEWLKYSRLEKALQLIVLNSEVSSGYWTRRVNPLVFDPFTKILKNGVGMNNSIIISENEDQLTLYFTML